MYLKSLYYVFIINIQNIFYILYSSLYLMWRVW